MGGSKKRKRASNKVSNPKTSLEDDKFSNSGGGGKGRVWSNKALPWRSISLEDGDDNKHGEQDDVNKQRDSLKSKKKILDYNHYDAEYLVRDGKGRQTLKHDLGGLDDNNSFGGGGGTSVDGSGGMAMLFGFEVLDANSYEIKTHQDSLGGTFTTVVPTTVTGSTQESTSTDEKNEANNTNNNNDDDEDKQQTDGGTETAIHNDGTKKSKKKKKNNKKKKKKLNHDARTINQNDVADPTNAKATNSDASSTNKNSNKNDSKASNDDNGEENDSETSGTNDATTKKDDDNEKDIDEHEVERIQNQWNADCGYGAVLHPLLCRGLAKMKFEHPMPIQAATLPAAIMGRRNIVGAAPTGSGKTLAYVLPILQHILYDKEGDEILSNKQQMQRALVQGLVLCPTRELALQVQKEIQQVSLDTIRVICLVGGLAMQKQDRLLTHPQGCHVIVATPGRLWDLIQSNDYMLLNTLGNTLQFLVLDEADRMIRPGSFPQLKSILQHVRTASSHIDENETKHDDNDTVDKAKGDDDNDARKEDDDDSDRDDEDAKNDEMKKENEVKEGEDNKVVGDNTNDDDNDIDELLDHEEMSKLLPGWSNSDVPGEVTNLTMLNESILQQVEQQRLQPTPTPKEIKYFDPNHLRRSGSKRGGQDTIMENDTDKDVEEETKSNTKATKRTRQTFIYSATLTLPSVLGQGNKKKHDGNNQKKKKGKKQRRNVRPNTVEGALGEMLDLAGATGPTKVVDLTSANVIANLDRNYVDGVTQNTTTETKTNKDNDQLHQRLPSTLTVLESKCILKHKDTQLYAYLVTTKEGTRGPSLIFCNSIQAVRRVTEFLKVLGLPSVRAIHAQMPQKTRLSALETLQSNGNDNDQQNQQSYLPRPVVVATDVAARGLDIPTVTSVVHYDVARSVDTFIHRAGRTARAGSEGTSVSLVCPAEDSKHTMIQQTLFGSTTKGFETLALDGRLLQEAHARASLASKIVSYDDQLTKVEKEKQWFATNAKEADIELSSSDEDDEMITNKKRGGTAADGIAKHKQNNIQLQQCRQQEIRQAKQQLQSLLQKPMRKQHYGKFLSGKGVRESIHFEQEVKPHVVSAEVAADSGNGNNHKSKRKKKRQRNA